MCGIAGLLASRERRFPDETLESMLAAIGSRGPDSRGVLCELDGALVLGHLRLAIVDLSPTGYQPMASASGRYAVILNGEIYNFRDIRAELEAGGVGSWRGSSDTEVLLAAIECWGLEAALRRCEGMFAIALWDRRERTLTLARDRFGEKPLFVTFLPQGIAFASQLGAIMAIPGVALADDEDAIDRYLALSYVPEPRTPFRQVSKLPAGTYAVLKQGDKGLNPIVYWSAAESALRARNVAADPRDVVARIEQRLHTVVGNQMLADVPLGAFLSGGIDSSLIVALMQKQSSRPVCTFTIGFEDESFDEAPFARAVAGHLGTDHTELMVTWQDALDLVGDLSSIYDEPFADSSQLPTYIVSRMARKHVTVALTGDAGDEVFAGYNRHLAAFRHARLSEKLPAGLRNGAGALLAAVGTSSAVGAVEKSLRLATGGRSVRQLGEKLSKLSSLFRSDDDVALYDGLVRRDGGLCGRPALLEEFVLLFETLKDDGLDLTERMMLLDTLTYLPGDILTKVDRASMAVSLETRAPYLDHKLFELAWQLPIEAKIRDGKTKSVLRGLLAKHVPERMFERQKSGFAVPIARWLRGSLRGWMNDTMEAFRDSYPRHAQLADKALSALASDNPTVHHLVWNMLMLQAWHDRHRTTGACRRLAVATTG